ncbi:MAG TPA: hypothetical protein VMW36_08500, partial [Patescibacteria group bacterium]|nr:hypothetical protein [Patescibacteria group bacterium]
YSGVNMAVRNVKNKTFRPFAEAEEIKLFFKTGVDPTSGLLKCLLQDERVAMKSAGNYYVLPEYVGSGKEEYVFKASKSENRMPIEVILENPSLIDAASREEVEEYLGTFGDAMKDAMSDDFEEKQVFDEDGNPVAMSYDAYDSADEEFKEEE